MAWAWNWGAGTSAPLYHPDVETVPASPPLSHLGHRPPGGAQPNGENEGQG